MPPPLDSGEPCPAKMPGDHISKNPVTALEVDGGAKDYYYYCQDYYYFYYYYRFNPSTVRAIMLSSSDALAGRHALGDLK